MFLMGHVVLEDWEGKHKGILEVSSAPLPLSSATHPGPSVPQPGSQDQPLPAPGLEGAVERAGNSLGNGHRSVPFLPPALVFRDVVGLFFGRRKLQRFQARVCSAVPCRCWTRMAKEAPGAGL